MDNNKKIAFAALWNSKRPGCMTGKFDNKLAESLKEAGLRASDCTLLMFAETEKKSDKSPDFKLYLIPPKPADDDERF